MTISPQLVLSVRRAGFEESGEGSGAERYVMESARAAVGVVQERAGTLVAADAVADDEAVAADDAVADDEALGSAAIEASALAAAAASKGGAAVSDAGLLRPTATQAMAPATTMTTTAAATIRCLILRR